MISQTKNKPLFKYILALLLFGSNGIVASFIPMGSTQIVFLRTLLGSILLIALFLLTGGRFTFRQHKKHFIYLAVSGIAMGASWMFLYEAYVHLGVSIASLLYYCGPVIVMVLAPRLFGESFTIHTVISFLAVAAGILLVNGSDFREGVNGMYGLLGLMAAAMYAVMVIANKKASAIKGMENATLQLSISFLTVAVFLGATGGWRFTFTPQSLLPILILGLVNTGIGCYLYFSSIGSLPVQTIAVCGYLEPVSAVLFAMVFLGETMQSLQAVGALMILGGAFWGEYHRHGKTTPDQP